MLTAVDASLSINNEVFNHKAHQLQIVMVPRHIAGHLNVLADLASRTGQVIPSKWSLVGSTISGHMRKQSKSQVKRLHLPVSQPTGSGDRRVELLVAEQGTVCVFPNLYHQAIPPTEV